MLRRPSLLVLLGLSAACAFAAPRVEVVNNHDFPVRMPWKLHDASGDGPAILIDVPANGRQTLDAAAAPQGDPTVAIKPGDNSVALTHKARDLGALSWSLVLHKVDAETARSEKASAGRPAEFKPQPLTLSFKQTAQSPVFTTHSAETTAAGLHVRVDLDVYPAGFLDVRTTVTNQSAPTKSVYAAVLTHWSQPGVSARTADYNSAVSDLTGSTPWRRPGDRHQFVARGLNWFTASSPNGHVLWLNTFAPSFTVHKEATAKTPAQWVGANSPQLDQEAYVDGDTLTHVTELAHGSVRSYRSRLDDYVLPDKSQPLTFTHRLAFADQPISAESATRAFVAYTTYNSEQPGTGNREQATRTLNLGAPAVVFGTAYFPFSTLGENFIRHKLPGMSQDSYWPLAADVVKQYTLFADDIRRDLRIAKSMGFASVRLHHIEMLWTTDKTPVQVTDAERTAFLDFFFAELKHVGLTAQLDVKTPAARIAEVVRRYRPQIDSVEIDNEVLIFGIKDEDVQYWKDCYAAVKAVAPDLPVHLTGHTNTAAFKRLDALGVPYDKLGQHAYTDGVSAIPMSRDFALQVASQATRANKPLEITEWNWRFLTRLTEEQRAKVYAPIFEGPLKARAVPKIYQFQFNDSLAMSPLSLKGIRHYELLNLSRRPKAEAAEFQRLIDTYSAPDSTTRTLKVERQVVTLAADAAPGTVRLPFKNLTDKTLTVTARLEMFEGKAGEAAPPVKLEPGAEGSIDVMLHTPRSPAGFYHYFVRLEDVGNKVLRYAWIEVRRSGQPNMDRTTTDVAYSDGALDLDLTKPTAVVYGDDCPILELEAAWVIYQTLESATGVRTQIFTASELPETGITNTIYVGTLKSLPRDLTAGTPADKRSVTRLPNSATLVITGPTSRDAALAAMDYTLRYWRTAKDAACRRVPLVEREIPKGGDAAQLP